MLQRANATEYGLASGVFTRDISKALYVSEKLQAGTVFVNTYNKTDVAAPFGGFKQSGFGKDLGKPELCMHVCKDKSNKYVSVLLTLWVSPPLFPTGQEALNEYLKTKAVTIEY